MSKTGANGGACAKCGGEGAIRPWAPCTGGTESNDRWRNVQLDLVKVDVNTLGTTDCKALRAHVLLVLNDVDRAIYTNEISESDARAILRITGRLIRELHAKS